MSLAPSSRLPLINVAGEVGQRNQEIAPIDHDNFGAELSDLVVIVAPAVDIRSWHIIRPSCPLPLEIVARCGATGLQPRPITKVT